MGVYKFGKKKFSEKGNPRTSMTSRITARMLPGQVYVKVFSRLIYLRHCCVTNNYLLTHLHNHAIMNFCFSKDDPNALCGENRFDCKRNIASKYSRIT